MASGSTATGGRRCRLRRREGGRGRRECPFEPFAWLASPPSTSPCPGSSSSALAGDAALGTLARARSLEAFDGFVKTARDSGALDVIRPLESQFLLQHRARLYGDLAFAKLRRCQVDIETGFGRRRLQRPGKRPGTGCSRSACAPAANEPAPHSGGHDRRGGEAAARRRSTRGWPRSIPTSSRGTTSSSSTWTTCASRCRMRKVPCAWGRFGQKATFRSSRLKVAERWIDFPRCDLPGRAVVDTYLLALLNDITARELNSYGLKEVAVHFGITEEDGPQRTYIEGSRIAEAFANDRARFRAYLEDDLRETQGLARPPPADLLRAGAHLPDPAPGGDAARDDGQDRPPLPRGILPREAVLPAAARDPALRRGLHPQLQRGRVPPRAPLRRGVALPEPAAQHRAKPARTTRWASSSRSCAGSSTTGCGTSSSRRPRPTEEERAEAQARQSAFKILINSFYGYLGFSGARFGDGELAAEVTRRGRELLQQLIDEFGRHGCRDARGGHGRDLPVLGRLLRPAGGPPRARRPDPARAGSSSSSTAATTRCSATRRRTTRCCEAGRIILRGSALRSRGHRAVPEEAHRHADPLPPRGLGRVARRPRRGLPAGPRRPLASRRPRSRRARSSA